jgi:hypothetical protein
MKTFNLSDEFRIKNWVSFNSHYLFLGLAVLVFYSQVLLILGDQESLHANLIVKSLLSYFSISKKPIIHYFYHLILAKEYFYSWYPCTLLNSNHHPKSE